MFSEKKVCVLTNICFYKLWVLRTRWILYTKFVGPSSIEGTTSFSTRLPVHTLVKGIINGLYNIKHDDDDDDDNDDNDDVENGIFRY